MPSRLRKSLLELAEETLSGHVRDLLAGRLPDRPVRRDDHNPLAPPVLRRQALDDVVRVGCVADLERAVSLVRTLSVEDDDAARALEGDEARQPIDERAAVGKRPRVQDVGPVEEVEHCLRMPVERLKTA